MYVVDVQDVLLHNFAGRQSVTLEEVQAGYYFSFLPAITRRDQVSPCRDPGSHFSRIIIGLHEPQPFAFSSTYHFPVPESMQREK